MLVVPSSVGSFSLIVHHWHGLNQTDSTCDMVVVKCYGNKPLQAQVAAVKSSMFCASILEVQLLHQHQIIFTKLSHRQTVIACMVCSVSAQTIALQ
jgi:hypothetical protein